MEYRKLIKFGRGSYVVSLPKHWLKKKGVEKGDSLHLNVDNSKITVYPDERDEEHEEIQRIIKVEDQSLQVIQKKINAAYINNADTIRLQGDGLNSNLEDIKKKIQNLIAMEVVEQTTERLVAKSFLKMDDVEVPETMRKADHMIRTMFKDLHKAAESPVIEAVELSDSITQRDEDVNKMCMLAFRALNYEQKRGPSKDGLEEEDMLGMWGLNFFIEEIGDEIKRIARIAGKYEDRELMQDYSEVIQEISKNYANAMKGFYKEDKGLIYSVAEKRDELLQKCDEVLKDDVNSLTASLLDKTKDLIDKVQNLNRMSIMSGMANT